jgi:molybdopterin converting factor small subunit
MVQITYQEETMARVVIPYPLRKHTNNQREVEATGGTLNEVMDSVFNQFPGLKDSLNPLDFIAIFVNGERIKSGVAEWPAVSVGEGDEIAIILPIAGGLSD